MWVFQALCPGWQPQPADCAMLGVASPGPGVCADRPRHMLWEGAAGPGRGSPPALTRLSDPQRGLPQVVSEWPGA